MKKHLIPVNEAEVKLLSFLLFDSMDEFFDGKFSENKEIADICKADLRTARGLKRKLDKIKLEYDNSSSQS